MDIICVHIMSQQKKILIIHCSKVCLHSWWPQNCDVLTLCTVVYIRLKHDYNVTINNETMDWKLTYTKKNSYMKMGDGKEIVGNSKL